MKRQLSSNPSIDLAGRGETILLVDDSESIRSSMGTFLELKGYKVFRASSGKEALEVSRKENGPVHVIISDMDMPGMSGWDLAVSIESDRPQTRILFMSGYSDEIKGQGTLKRDSSFLQKPVSMETLLRKLRELLQE